VDPRTLETRGYVDFGSLRGPMTAHPKIDPVTGEFLFFGYNGSGRFTPTINFGSLDRNGTVTRFDRLEAPYPSMVHDFMVTERHLLFPILPLTGSMERARSGRPPYAWEPDKGAFIGIMPRSGDVNEIRWFQGEACYVFHVMNAWEEGDSIIAEVIVHDEPPLFPHADGSPVDHNRESGRLTRWTFDLVAGTSRFKQETIDDLVGEFPRMDDRHCGLPHHHGWFAAINPDAKFDGPNDYKLCGLAHIDRHTGRRQTFWLPAGDVTSEPVFVPRGDSEGDGWLLSVVWRRAEAHSEVLVFEAMAIESGPIASITLPQRVPFGFHGNWVGH
jgi:carotenoid cleavage dioxygenase-like enzyme